MTLVPGKEVVCDCVVEPSTSLHEDQVNVTTNAFSLLKVSTSALTIKNLHCANRVFNHSRCPKFSSTITMFSILSFNWFLNESASRHFQHGEEKALWALRNFVKVRCCRRCCAGGCSVMECRDPVLWSLSPPPPPAARDVPSKHRSRHNHYRS